MATRIDTLDIDTMPELARIADEVAATGRSRSLRRGGREIAVLQPIRSARRRRKPSAKDVDAFRMAAGSWKDVDTDRFLADIYASRDMPPRPPIDL